MPQLLAITTEAVSSTVGQGPKLLNVDIFIYIHYIQKYWQTAEECTPVQLSLRTVILTHTTKLIIAYLKFRI